STTLSPSGVGRWSRHRGGRPTLGGALSRARRTCGYVKLRGPWCQLIDGGSMHAEHAHRGRPSDSLQAFSSAEPVERQGHSVLDRPFWSACGLPPLSSPAAVRDRVPPTAPSPRLRRHRKPAPAVVG